MIFKINVNDCNPGLFHIGRVAENDVTQIDFDLSAYIEEYGAGGGAVLTVHRYADSDPYLIPMIITDGIASWYISDADTSASGRGACQLTYTVGDKVKKTDIYPFSCGPSLEPTGEAPDPFESWLETLAAYTSETSANAAAARSAADDAATSAQNAQASAETSAGHATAAQASAQAAAASETQAGTYAGSASQSAASAGASATAARDYALDASASAGTAETHAAASAQSAAAASTSAGNAQTSAESASASEARAKQYADRAEEVSLEIPTKVSQLENDAGYVTEDALLAAFPADTASGAVASFPDGAALPLISLDVNIDPVQDLHGYANPWPAGGGKNLANPDTVRKGGYYNGSGDWSANNKSATTDLIPVKSNTVYVSSIFDKNGVRLSGCVATLWNDENTCTGQITSASFTTTESTKFVRIRNFDAQESYIISDDFVFQLEEGSTATDWTPYSNICPISGWAGMNVRHTGANIWDEEWELGSLNNTTGAKINTTSIIRSKNYIPVTPSTQYYFPNSDGYVLQYDADKNYIGLLFNRNINPTAINCRFLMFRLSSNYGTEYKNDFSINYPSTIHTYEPYNGTPITIDFGQTVYGGVLDVLSGKLRVTHGIADMGTLNPTMYTTAVGNLFRMPISGMSGDYNPSIPSEIYCSAYKTASYTTRAVNTIYQYNTGVDIIDNNYDNASDFKMAVSGVQVVYPLATPIEIQLDPHEVSSLLGANTIYADTGDTSVEYRADPTLFVNKKIAEAIAALG